MENQTESIHVPSVIIKGGKKKRTIYIILFAAIMVLLILFIYLLFFKTFNNTSSIYSDNLTPEAMKTDADFLIAALKENHPEMKEGQTTYNKIIDEIYKKIDKPMNSEDFYWTLNTLTVALKDGHTHLSAYPINRDFVDLPPLEWTIDGLIVKADKAFLKRGDKIVSIGGMGPDELLKNLECMIPAEVLGWVKVNSNAIAEGMYLRHLNLVDKDNSIVIRYERNGSVSTSKMHLLKSNVTIYKSIAAAISQISSRKLRWEIDKEHNLGIVTMNFCPSGQEYIKGFREFFDAVHRNNIENIAVDLRKNSGGNSQVIHQFLSFIDVQSYMFIGQDIFYNYPEQYRNIDNNDPSLFKGDIYVLTSNSTFSAATDFTVVLQANSIAKIIGQPTGNIAEFYGNARSYTLPCCKLEFQCATTRHKAPVPESDQDKAINPDYKVEYTRQDILENRDPYLEFIQKLCGS